MRAFASEARRYVTIEGGFSLRSLLYLKAGALRRLGIRNLARVAWYRLRLQLGIHPVQRIRRDLNGTKFFGMPRELPPCPPRPSRWQNEALYFGWFGVPLDGNPPDWHANPFTKQRVQHADLPWWKLADFETGVGDIKTVWEASRFDWVLAFAQHARSGDPEALSRLNAWLVSWIRANPAYYGPNWKCGQEASIRVMHLLLAARLLGQLENPLPAVVRLVEAHLARIYPTLSYALAQDNNHGTSEAAALFMGGNWCAGQLASRDRGLGPEGAKVRSVLPEEALVVDETQANVWAQAGRRWLEDRAARLIEPDGGFSQYSVNYHRLMLDTFCVAELWRRWLQLPAFSEHFQQRALAATRWLHAMIDPETGDAPNLGGNDGANLLPLTDADYRDYRPTVQLATALFAWERAYTMGGPHDHHLGWLGIEDVVEARCPHDSAEPRSNRQLRALRASIKGDDRPFHAAGYIVLRNGPWKTLFRYPSYRFRPRHSDPLHIDLWYKGDNLLRDAGSYSYNAGYDCMARFSGPTGHSTVHFDDRDPMPNVGRFLKGAWLRADRVHEPEHIKGGWSTGASYRDWQGAEHHRQLHLAEHGLEVVDSVSGFRKHAILRWRLLPCDWEVTPDGARCAGFTVVIGSDVRISQIELIDGWESRYYMNKVVVPVLELKIENPGTVTTMFRADDS